MRNEIVFLVCTWLLLGIVGHGSAQTQSGRVLSPEELLFQEIPILVAATRTERSLLDVPNAATVITAAEIRASGATSVAELLQTVPGLELMRLSATDLNLSARGFNRTSSSRALVMIDGRSVYLDFFGVVPWHTLNVTLQDIERIEVVRGPGSVLYGANAFLAVINIITKRSQELPALYVRTGLGPETGLVTATAAQHSDRAGIKASVEYRTRDHFHNEVLNDATNTITPVRHDRTRTGLRAKLFNATFDYQFDDETKLSVSGGHVDPLGDIHTGIGIHDYTGALYYGKLNFDRGPWQLQAFVNLIDYDLSLLPTVFPSPAPPAAAISSRIKSNSLDLELQRLHSFERHELLWGANFRRVITNSPVVFGSREAEALYAGFVHDEFHVTDRVTAFLGLRVDEHPTSGLNISPRTSLVVKIGEDARLNVGFTRSFRNPTTVENYADYDLPNSVLPLTVSVQGNKDLDPVWVTAYEIGFRAMPHPRLLAQMDLFYNILEDFPTFTTVDPGPPIAVLSYRNQGRTKAWGGELTLETQLSKSLRGFANYSFQSANGPFEGSTPRHKASFGVRGSLGSVLRYALTGVYVGHSRFEPDPATAASLPTDRIRSHFMVDGFVGARIREGLEVGLHARNLFHQVRRQHPLGDEIGSELLFTLTAEF